MISCFRPNKYILALPQFHFANQVQVNPCRNPQAFFTPDGPVASSVMLAGKVSVGGVVSWMVTFKLPLVVLPALSVAEQSTLVVPSGNVLPEAGVQDTVTEPSTMSVAEAEKVTTAPDGPVASAVISPGRVRIGAVVS